MMLLSDFKDFCSTLRAQRSHQLITIQLQIQPKMAVIFKSQNQGNII